MKELLYDRAMLTRRVEVRDRTIIESGVIFDLEAVVSMLEIIHDVELQVDVSTEDDILVFYWAPKPTDAEEAA